MSRVVNYTVSNISEINPLRFKGYYLDSESGLYYLNARYYDSNVGRFISADEIEYLGVDGTVIGYNLYSYCDNNPVNKVDESGNWYQYLVGAITGGILGFTSQLVLNIAFRRPLFEGVFRTTVTGAIGGILSATKITKVAAAVYNGVISASSNLIGQITDNGGISNINIGDVIVDGAIGAVAGYIGGNGFGKTNNITALNRKLTKKILEGSFETAKTGIKYYVSQNTTVLKNYLMQPIHTASVSAFFLTGCKNIIRSIGKCFS